MNRSYALPTWKDNKAVFPDINLDKYILCRPVFQSIRPKWRGGNIYKMSTNRQQDTSRIFSRSQWNDKNVHNEDHHNVDSKTIQNSIQNCPEV